MNLNSNSKYFYFLTLLYFIASLIGVWRHELWLDEAHHWLLARDSDTFLDLIENTRFEGHPILWNILLFVITRFSLNPFWMQFFHILIATSVVFLFLRKTPFSWIFKTLFIFGYFMFFEYNLISRNYILGVLFLFLTCTVFKERKKKFNLICLNLALATNVHAMFSVIALSLFLTLLFEQFQDKQLFKTQFVIGYFLFGFGLLLFLFQMQTTNFDWLLSSYKTIPIHEKLTKGFISLFKGILTIPDFRTIHFWNSNLLINVNKPLSAAFGLLAYLVPLFLFFKNRKILFFVYTALFGIQIFFFITQRGVTRFDGSIYIILIIGLWIENYYPSENYKIKAFFNLLKLNLLKRRITSTILIIHFCSGIYACTMDYMLPFSSSKAAVSFLKDNNRHKAIYVSSYCIINPKKAIHWKTIDNKIKIRFLENTPYYVFEIVKLNPNPKK